ncbi:hypothetical protein CVD25_13800 [Bacillus canaveralius]|uniref:Uncharacterized protein n=1 Tax=Bacillus canaveralius TaxID=1403243 RepID=A0A2N5GLA9_9BACI|nr:hypothetical protein [Bacillus canaveralius]PLR82424.1 hypothetical protein CU635_11465 [Bacillus canaveralius]PLR95595.1 hypothetical protein CVD25_13800 [Bacillus canaveralius]
MAWDCYEETHQNGKTYFNELETPMGQFRVNLITNVDTDITPYSVYLPTIAVCSSSVKDQLLSRIKQKVNEMDRSIQPEYVGRLSVIVIELNEIDIAKEVMEEVKQVVEDFAAVKI